MPDAREALPAATQTAFLALGVTSADLAPLHPEEPRPDLTAAEEYDELTHTGCTVAEAAARLGLGARRVRRRLTAHTLIGIRVGRNWRLPRFQFTDNGDALLPGIEALARHIGDLHPLDIATWVSTPQVDLALAYGGDEIAVSPRDWLLGGGDPQPLLPLIDELRGYA